MRIEITTDAGCWLRADLIDGHDKTNLLHRARMVQRSLMYDYEEAAAYVRYHWPQYKNVRIVTDLGSGPSIN